MKKVIIVGATSGMGRGLAVLFANDNFKVGITGRRADLLSELKEQKPGAFFTSVFDINDIHSVAERLEDLTSQLGGLDMVVISSGTGEENTTLDYAIEKSTIDTNVVGFTCVADWAFNYFVHQKSGHLLAITSVGGLRGNGDAPAYNATKAYQIKYLEGLRQRANKRGLPVLVTDIRPGFVDTAMAKGDGRFWVATVEKATRQIYGAVCRRKKVVYVTRRWSMIGAILKLVPRSLYDKM